MAGEVRAVIDVGTNSVKLLVADVEGKSVRPLQEGSHQTRLGQGFYESHVLQAGAIVETAKAVAEFVAEARAAWQPASIHVFATSAARDAVNKDRLIAAIENASGVPVTVISGETEADWAYTGVTTDPQLADRDLLVMDVGGGSTEFIFGRGAKRLYSESFPIGSVRLLERVPLSAIPTDEQKKRCADEINGVLETRVKPHLEPILRSSSGLQLVGTGGTSTILARIELRLRSFSREMIEGTLLSREKVKKETMRLWCTPLDQRKQIIGLPPNRADVILPGALIFQQVMELFQLDSLRVSTRGLRFAAAMAVTPTK